MQSQQNLYSTLAQMAGNVAQQRRLDRELAAQAKANQAEADKQAALAERLKGYTAENILSAPADLLAAVDKTSLDTLLRIAMQEKLAKMQPASTPSTGPLPAADIQRWNVMESQRKELGLATVEETPMFRMMAALKSHEFDQAEAATQFTQSMLANPTLQMTPAQAVQQGAAAAAAIADKFKPAPVPPKEAQPKAAQPPAAQAKPARTDTVQKWLDQQKAKKLETDAQTVLEPAPIPVE